MYLFIVLTFVAVSCPFAWEQLTVDGVLVQAPQSLSDGVAISQGTGLRGLAAHWVVLVVLEPPVYPMELKTRIAQVESLFGPIMEPYVLSQYIQDSWLHRLEELKTVDVFFSDDTGRVRRGLLDLGGEILHVLFGTVTSSQFHKYETVLQTMGSKLNAVIHFQSDLLSAMNQSRLYIKENRADITRLEVHQRVVDAFLVGVQHDLSESNRRVGTLEIQVEMERAISALEMAFKQYTSQVDLYHIHKASLEIGRLTEDLLPPYVLQEVLLQAAQVGYDYVSHMEWFYQFLTVEPVWQSGQNLVYKVSIPLLDKHT
jgi:hypothetical protein